MLHSIIVQFPLINYTLIYCSNVVHSQEEEVSETYSSARAVSGSDVSEISYK